MIREGRRGRKTEEEVEGELFTPSATLRETGGGGGGGGGGRGMSEHSPLSSVWSICVCLCSMMASLKKVRRHTGWFSSSTFFILRR